MKTDELVLMLARGDISVPRHAVAKRIGLALLLGLIAAFGLMLALLGIRPDLSEAIKLPMFWIKLVFALSLGVVGLIAVKRLAQPGATLKGLPWVFALPIGMIWVMALVVLAQASPLQRAHLVLGETWYECPFLITMLSLPIFIAAIWAMRSFAPTRLGQAGAAVGLMAGGWGAVVYCLHCPEMGAPFIGIWYLIGILIPAGIGAMVGKTLLRW